MDPSVHLWSFLIPGYLTSIAIETPVLLAGLSARHSVGVRLFAGVWLTACTYPIVVLVLYPLLMPNLALYLGVAETVAPVAECALFWAAFGSRAEWGKRSMWQDFAVITLANLASFGIGELLNLAGWFTGGPG